MDHYIPKRRVPVLLWSSDLRGTEGQLFLDLDPSGHSHPTLLDKLNEAERFLPVAVGPQGRIELFHKSRLTRVSPSHGVIQADAFARGFQPWREEAAQVVLADGAVLDGRVWTPLDRPTQRLSDFMNQRGGEFFVLLTESSVQFVNAAAVVRMSLTEEVGATLGWSTRVGEEEPAPSPSPSLAVAVPALAWPPLGAN